MHGDKKKQTKKTKKGRKDKKERQTEGDKQILKRFCSVGK